MQEIEEVEVDEIDLVEAYFQPIYLKLKEMGVPEDRFPTTVQIVSHLVELTPEKALQAWLDAYARAEAPAKKVKNAK